MPDILIAVEYLRGGEQTPFGEVAYIVCEADGVDVVFVGAPGEESPCSHFAHGETIRVSGSTDTEITR